MKTKKKDHKQGLTGFSSFFPSEFQFWGTFGSCLETRVYVTCSQSYDMASSENSDYRFGLERRVCEQYFEDIQMKNVPRGRTTHGAAAGLLVRCHYISRTTATARSEWQLQERTLRSELERHSLEPLCSGRRVPELTSSCSRYPSSLLLLHSKCLLSVL